MPDECNPFKPLKCNSTSYEKKERRKKTVFGRVQFKWKLQYNIDGDERHNSPWNFTRFRCFERTDWMFVCVNGFFFHSVRIVHSKCAAPGQSNNHCLRQHIQRAKTIASIWWDREKKREKKKSNLSKNPADYSFNKKVLLVLNNNQAIWNMYGPWCAYTRFVIAVGLDLFI